MNYEYELMDGVKI